jgi:dUTP pyrophosphatase
MRILKTREVKTPERSGRNAGIDFFIPFDFEEVHLEPSESIMIPSGIKAKVPEGFCMIAFNKSGVATKKQLIVGACVVDENYTGEIHLHVINTSPLDVWITPGEKLVQFVVLRPNYVSIEEVEEEENLKYINETERGDHGFGSTDV